MTNTTTVRRLFLAINVVADADGKPTVEMLTPDGSIESAAAALGNIFAPALPAAPKPVQLTPPVVKEEPKPAVVVDDLSALRQKAKSLGIKCWALPNVKGETLKKLIAEKESGSKPAPSAPPVKPAASTPAPSAPPAPQSNGGNRSFGGGKPQMEKADCLPVKCRTKDGTKIISVWVTAKQKTKAGVEGYRVCRPDTDADCPATHIYGAVWFVPATAIVEWCEHPE